MKNFMETSGVFMGVAGMCLETFALVKAALSPSYPEGTYWLAMAIYAGVWAITVRQLNSGQSLFKRSNPSSEARQ